MTAENTDPSSHLANAHNQGAGSRSVVLGLERLWLSADPQLLESIVHNATALDVASTRRLCRALAASLRSATVLVVEGVDNFGAIDAGTAKRMESLGRRSTYLISTAELAPALKAPGRICSRA